MNLQHCSHYRENLSFCQPFSYINGMTYEQALGVSLNVPLFVLDFEGRKIMQAPVEAIYFDEYKSGTIHIKTHGNPSLIHEKVHLTMDDAIADLHIILKNDVDEAVATLAEFEREFIY